MSQSSIVMPSVVSDRSFSRTAQQQLSFLNIQAYCTPRLGLAYSFFKQMIVSDLGSDLARIRQPNRIWHIPQMDCTMIVWFRWQECPGVLSPRWLCAHQITAYMAADVYIYWLASIPNCTNLCCLDSDWLVLAFNFHQYCPVVCLDVN
jgi:hypothetical protein